MMFPVLSRQTIAGYLRRALAFCAVPLLLFAVPALADDGIEDIFVTVYDMNARPITAVLQHERINGFTKVPIFASVDATGRANVSWTAISVDDSARLCGHGAKRGLEGGALVSVQANSAC